MTSPVAYRHVPDIEAKLAETIAAGATVKEPARDVGGGRLVATATDPATCSGCFSIGDSGGVSDMGSRHRRER